MSDRLKIKDLIPDDANFNTGTEFGNALLEKSLSKFGAGRSILLDKNNRIIAGNKTVENAAAVGLDDVQIVETDGTRIIAVKRTDVDLDSKQGREMALADNATAKANINWDAEKIFDWEMPAADWGVHLETIEPIEPSDAEPQIDKAAELNKKWQVKTGDLWQIGEHRLLCGNCTDKADVQRVTDGERMQLCLTDPPYNVGRDYHGQIDDQKADYELWSRQWFGLAKETAERVAFSCGHPNVVMWAGIEAWHWMICWYKSNAMLGSPFGFSNWEPVLFYGKPHRPKGQDVINVPIVVQKDLDAHDCPKQLGFGEKLVDLLSEPTDRIYEPFAGSGTTLVACQNLNRKCYAIEISENYCAVILERMAKAFPELEIKRIEAAKNAEIS